MKEKIQQYLNGWKSKGYADGIPDTAPSKLEKLNKAPSYRNVCKAILKNDFSLVSLGMSKGYSQVYSDIKRAEIASRRES